MSAARRVTTFSHGNAGSVRLVRVPGTKEGTAVIDRHLITLAKALQRIDDDVPTLQAWGQTAASALAAGGRLFACGAGPSADQARHVVTELASSDDDRPPLAAATLEAPAASAEQCAGEAADVRTAIAGRVRRDCRPGDVLLCLSATAADEGTAAAAATAGAAGVKTWALTGQAPNAVASACTEAVCVDAVARSTIEEVQVAAIHIFCSAVNAAMRDAIRAGHQSDLA
jgi:D-sedoheptulose 7-phosphate isomerase